MREPLDELKLMGQKLGGLWWVQGPGGNVSVKTSDGELWVKASGRRLASVAEEDGHSRVGLSLAEKALEGDAGAERQLFAAVPRPSLETYFHALPGRVVAHTHSLGVLLLACSSLAQESQPAKDIRYTNIPYIRPGRGIALAIQNCLPAFNSLRERHLQNPIFPLWAGKASRRSNRDCRPEPRSRRVLQMANEQVYLLRNHGLVVFAQEADRAIALTQEFDYFARQSFEPLPSFEQLVESYLTGPELIFDGGIARRIPDESQSCGKLSADNRQPRYLFPDAAVYASKLLVDSSSCRMGNISSCDAKVANDKQVCAIASKGLFDLKRSFVLICSNEGACKSGQGENGTQVGQRYVVAKNRSQLEDACSVLAAHDYVEEQLLARGIACYLAPDEPGRIVSMPSEQYRINSHQ